MDLLTHLKAKMNTETEVLLYLVLHVLCFELCVIIISPTCATESRQLAPPHGPW